MKLRDFLSLVLPEQGIKYAADLYEFETREQKKVKAFRHYGQGSIHELATTLQGMDEDQKTVYFALAGFAEPRQAVDKRTGELKVTPRGAPKMEQRTADLALAARSLWADLDCDLKKAERGLGYNNKEEALKAVVGFTKDAGLATPIIVDSGGGLHCYWPFTQDVPAPQWLKMAKLWRQTLVAYGVRSDPSRDMDIASVLRPPQTHNHKYDPPRPVTVLNTAPVTPSEPAAVAKALLQALNSKGERPNPPELPRSEAPAGQVDRLGDLEDAVQRTPSYARILVKHCNQVLQFHQLGGDVEEPVWRGALGLLKHTEEGPSIAHEWSSGFSGYDATETQEKIDRWEHGPTTCKYFDQVNPQGCKKCGHKGKITSPIQLGYKSETSSKTEDVVVESGGVEIVVEGISLPPKYSQHVSGGLLYMQTDADGVVHPTHFSRVTFYPVARVKTHEGTYSYRFRVIKLDGSVRYFDLPAGDTAAATLIETLASHEVYMTNLNMAKHMRQYVVDFCAQMAETAEEVRTYDQYGWHEDMSVFVLGERAYCEDGEVRQAMVVGNAAACQGAFAQIKPDPKPWVDAVDWLYNRNGMTHMQYALCSGFGSLLGPFQSDLYAGIPLALTDSDSGKGKTTVCKLALTAFGSWRDMTISTAHGATNNARIATLAAHGNVPVLIDEITDIDAGDLAAFLYAVSNGRDRLRLHTTGTLRNTSSWNLSAYLTANENLGSKLASMVRDTEGNQVRIFEISTKKYPVPSLNPVEVDHHVTRAQLSMGSVGDAYIRYLATHRPEVMDVISSFKHRLNKACPELEAPQWRFFRYHAECTLASAFILNQLGFVSFDIRKLYAWTIEHLRSMGARITDQKVLKSGPEDILDALLRDFHDKVITTYGYRKGRDLEIPLQQVRGTPYGRFVLGERTDKTPEWYNGKLMLSKTAVTEWCSEHRVDPYEWVAVMEKHGFIVAPPTKTDRMVLGRGTTLVAGQTRCWVFDMTRVRGGALIQAVTSTTEETEETQCKSTS